VTPVAADKRETNPLMTEREQFLVLVVGILIVVVAALAYQLYVLQQANEIEITLILPNLAG
jgi:hypothetical protein